MIATDHAPHTPEEKTRNDIWSVDCGFPGVETQMPAMLTAVNEGRMSISDYVRWSSFNPAQQWGLYPRKGAIQPGSDADIAIVDLGRSWTIDDAKTQSRSKISPWHGRAVKGLPIHTLVRGRFVMRDRTLMPECARLGPLRSRHSGDAESRSRATPTRPCRRSCRSPRAGRNMPHEIPGPRRAALSDRSVRPARSRRHSPTDARANKFMRWRKRI